MKKISIFFALIIGMFINEASAASKVLLAKGGNDTLLQTVKISTSPTLEVLWKKICLSKNEKDARQFFAENQMDINVLKYLLEKFQLPARYYSGADGDLAIFKNRKVIEQEIAYTPYFYVDFKMLKEQYLVDHMLGEPSSVDTENVKSLLINRFVTKRFQKGLEVADKIQIVRCVAEWRDLDNGIVPVKDWIVTKDMVREFGALQNFFKLSKREIRTGADLAAIRDDAQNAAARIVSLL